MLIAIKPKVFIDPKDVAVVEEALDGVGGVQVHVTMSSGKVIKIFDKDVEEVYKYINKNAGGSIR